MNFQEAHDKALADIKRHGYETHTMEKFRQEEYYGIIEFRKQATWKSPIRMIVQVRSDYVKNFNGKNTCLVKEQKAAFMKKVGF